MKITISLHHGLHGEISQKTALPLLSYTWLKKESDSVLGNRQITVISDRNNDTYGIMFESNLR